MLLPGLALVRAPAVSRLVVRPAPQRMVRSALRLVLRPAWGYPVQRPGRMTGRGLRGTHQTAPQERVRQTRHRRIRDRARCHPWPAGRPGRTGSPPVSSPPRWWRSFSCWAWCSVRCGCRGSSKVRRRPSTKPAACACAPTASACTCCSGSRRWRPCSRHRTVHRLTCPRLRPGRRHGRQPVLRSRQAPGLYRMLRRHRPHSGRPCRPPPWMCGTTCSSRGAFWAALPRGYPDGPSSCLPIRPFASSSRPLPNAGKPCHSWRSRPCTMGMCGPT